MLREYPKEELQKIYEDLPDVLKEALFSKETAGIISDICVENGIEKAGELVSKLVGHALLGLLPPDEFPKTLKEELGLKNDKAKKVALEINSLVFYPLKESLEALYKIEVEKPKMPTKEEAPEEKSRAKRVKDAYREATE